MPDISDPLVSLHLELPYLAPAQAQKHVTHNEALRRLDAIVQLAVLGASPAAPPAAPEEGDRYIIAAGATDDWEGQDGKIAAFIDGAWLLFDAAPGWIAYDMATESVLVRRDDGWTAIGSALGAITGLGINADADDTNRLSVRSNSVLFADIDAADGGTGDIRFVINKETDADTASLLFQSGFSGRAEMGLAGDTDLVFKVSADGSTWTEAIRIDKDTGLSAILYNNAGSGLAAGTVQDAIDEVAAAKAARSANLSDIGDPATAFANIKQAATDAVTGVVELATTTEALAGTDTTRVVTPAGLRAATREKLTANRDYYVRTDGSDSNNGLANTSGGAFLTIQKAIDAAFATLDLAGFNVTIHVDAGTYTGGISLTKVQVGAGTISVVGDTTTPSNVTISASSVCVLISGIGVKLSIAGMKITSSGSIGLYADQGAQLTVSGKVEFGSCSSGHHMRAISGGLISIQSIAYTISGGAGRHFSAETQGSINAFGSTVTLSGTPAFANAFAYAERLALMNANGMSFSGSATGTRYSAISNSVINTGGGGASYFPGSTGGSTGTGGLYL